MKGKNFYFILINLLKQGKNPSAISKTMKVSKQNINYHIRKLKSKGIVQKKGYGTWEVKNITSNMLSSLPNKKEIRGHAFIWTVKLNKEYNWEELLRTTKHKLIRSSIPRLIINNKKIWLGKKTITIYENRSFYAINPIESRKYAVVSLLEVLDALQNKLKINLKPYIFKPAREHYGMIKNDLARQYNRQGKKLHIKDDIEGIWLWIDDSESLAELETKNIVRSKQVQNWWNNHKKHDFKVDSDFVLRNMNDLIQDRLFWAEHQKSHVKSIQTLSKEVKGLSRTIKSIRKENQSLKLKADRQKTLIDF